MNLRGGSCGSIPELRFVVHLLLLQELFSEGREKFYKPVP